MKNYDDSDDPIQEVGGKNPFSKLKSFENDLEYKFQKEMEEFEKYLDEEKLKEENNLNNIDYSNSGNYAETPNINTSANINTNTASLGSIYFMFFVFICVIAGFAFIFISSILQEDTGARVISESELYQEENYNYILDL